VSIVPGRLLEIQAIKLENGYNVNGAGVTGDLGESGLVIASAQ
jgi:hypothetical protein